MKIAAMIVAAGAGLRFKSDTAKQYKLLDGKPILQYSLDQFAEHSLVDLVLPIIHPDHQVMYSQNIHIHDKVFKPCLGGNTRQESVLKGLHALEDIGDIDYVLIHDAARPLVDKMLINNCIDRLCHTDADAVFPSLTVSDTLRRHNPNDNSFETVDRTEMYRVQTPQGFDFMKILSAHQKYQYQSVTDDIALAEMTKMKINMINGTSKNFKITEAQDLDIAEFFLAQEKKEAGAA